MFDSQKFILEIEKRRDIWAQPGRGVRDWSGRKRTWEEVGEAMYSKWLGMTAEARNHRVTVMKKKWRNIRDCYAKALRLQKNNSDERKKRKYLYFDTLHFLKETFPRLSSNIGNPELNDVYVNHHLENMSDPEYQEGEDSFSLIPKRSISMEDLEIESSSRDQDIQLLSDRSGYTSAEQNRKKSKILDDDDPDDDKAFFMSMLPMVNKLNQQQKIDFRIEMLKTIKRLQFPGTT